MSHLILTWESSFILSNTVYLCRELEKKAKEDEKKVQEEGKEKKDEETEKKEPEPVEEKAPEKEPEKKKPAIRQAKSKLERTANVSPHCHAGPYYS